MKISSLEYNVAQRVKTSVQYEMIELGLTGRADLEDGDKVGESFQELKQRIDKLHAKAIADYTAIRDETSTVIKSDEIPDHFHEI